MNDYWMKKIGLAGILLMILVLTSGGDGEVIGVLHFVRGRAGIEDRGVDDDAAIVEILKGS